MPATWRNYFFPNQASQGDKVFDSSVPNVLSDLINSHSTDQSYLIVSMDFA